MQLEAIYREGRIQFTTPVRLKHHDIRVRIEIPDEEIETAPDSPGSRETSAGFVDGLKAVQSPVRDLLQSPDNKPLGKDERRELRARA